jgi:hypothetical protein
MLIRVLRAAEQIAEKLSSGGSGAKAPCSKQSFTAALKALRHPGSNFSANCKAPI